MKLLEQQLIDEYQKDLPVCSRPYLEVAKRLGVTESDVVSALKRLKENGTLSRIGPVFNHKKAGASTLAAMAVPEAVLAEVAERVNAFEGVNHNYAREHKFNLWFVVTAPDQDQLQASLKAIELSGGYKVMSLPMVKSHFIDLGFKVKWQ
ncbi:MAG: Lrp/AsnC family transcriptional regulator [Oleispira antarctica]|uniref:siroheme decarboxylase n=1 Tax=Oleispira antarctica RB-8 TaxID=698738 RepID=R4YN81_OLEAN|nr:Lrp/AsnC family transcriptional regulator [Oleispira antarctica]MBQ0792509.1 Lrp/AsnC family transcriptional regulator [Oleispira antarctica]CCK76407.1 Transcriptional regulator [Oleispira antarctica RB-8]|tara:strand:+ start:126 stop:575 length:450 start_codon:yes stop_codon:yes gene_type:complete